MGKYLNLNVSIAKNYLNEEHLKALQRIVSAYLDLAESRAINQKVMNMKDWENFLIQFLELSNLKLLTNSGKISMLEAKLKAETKFEKYRIVQDQLFESDFDKMIKKTIER